MSLKVILCRVIEKDGQHGQSVLFTVCKVELFDGITSRKALGRP